jgi:hypothetical protein
MYVVLDEDFPARSLALLESLSELLFDLNKPCIQLQALLLQLPGDGADVREITLDFGQACSNRSQVVEGNRLGHICQLVFDYLTTCCKKSSILECTSI